MFCAKFLKRETFSFCRVPGRPARMPGKMSGYKPGIPQQPYTKWDTDKDEVEVDYKRLDARHTSCFSGRKGFVLKVRGPLVLEMKEAYFCESQLPCLTFSQET